jgi:HlyD family secretion protein
MQGTQTTSQAVRQRNRNIDSQGTQTTSQAVRQRSNNRNTQDTQADNTTNARRTTNAQSQYANNPELAQYYKNTVRKAIEVGLSDEDYIEVVSGLNEGDEVLLPPVYPSTTNTQTNAGGSPFGGMGGGRNTTRMGGGNSGGGNSGGNSGGGNSGGSTNNSGQNRGGGFDLH